MSFDEFVASLNVLGMRSNEVQLMKHYQKLDIENSGNIAVAKFVEFLVKGHGSPLLTTLECMCMTAENVHLREWEEENRIGMEIFATKIPFYVLGSQSGNEKWDIFEYDKSINHDEKKDDTTTKSLRHTKNNTVFHVPKNGAEFGDAVRLQLKASLKQKSTSDVQTAPNKERIISIIIAGPSKSGKSSLFQRFVFNTFPNNYSATVAGGNVEKCKVQYQGDEYIVKVIDTPDTQGLFREQTYKFINDGVDSKDATDGSVDILLILIDENDNNWKSQMELYVNKYHNIAFEITSNIHNDKTMYPLIRRKRVPIIFVSAKTDDERANETVECEYICMICVNMLSCTLGLFWVCAIDISTNLA